MSAFSISHSIAHLRFINASGSFCSFSRSAPSSTSSNAILNYSDISFYPIFQECSLQVPGQPAPSSRGTCSAGPDCLNMPLLHSFPPLSDVLNAHTLHSTTSARPSLVLPTRAPSILADLPLALLYNPPADRLGPIYRHNL